MRFLLSPVARWAFSAVAAVGLLWGAYAWIEGKGTQKEKVRVEKQNDAATDAADAAELGLEQCLAADGVFWDFAASKCRRDW